MKTRSSTEKAKRKDPPEDDADDDEMGLNESNAKKKSKHSSIKIPDVLYSKSGATFYPCKHCCRAFASKKDMLKHSIHCSMPLLDLTTIKDNSSSDDEELNNNGNVESTSKTHKINTNTDSSSSSTIKIETKHKVQSSLINIHIIPESINTFDLKTKAKIVRNLNKVLRGSPVGVTVMECGDIVVRFNGTTKTPHMETTLKKIGNNLVQINTKLLCGGTDDEKIPSLNEIIEKLFGIVEDDINIDQLLSIKAESPLPVSLQEQSVECGLNDEIQDENPDENNEEDEENDELDEELDDSVKNINGTIVLEDLDIHICKQCGAVYQTLEDLVNHDKYEHRKFKKRFAPNELAKYTEIFKASKDNVCPICMKQLKNKWSWTRHYQTHSEVPEFQCTICKKKFTRNDHRKNHEKRHLIGAAN